MKKKKGFVGISVIIYLALIIILGGTFAYTKQQQTSNGPFDKKTDSPSPVIATSSSEKSAELGNNFSAPTESECGGKTDEHSKNLCYEHLAVETSSINTCDKISDDRNQRIKKLCRDAVNAKLAIIEQNESYCAKIIGSKFACYASLAVLKNNASLCKMSGNNDACIANMAIKQANPSFCEEIQPGHERNVCFSSIGQSMADAGLCEKAGDEKEICLSKVAVVKEDVNLCSGLSDSSRQYCYLRIADKKSDVSICEMISDPSIKDNCIINIK